VATLFTCALDAQRGAAEPDRNSPCHERLTAIAPAAPDHPLFWPRKIGDAAPKFPAIPTRTVVHADVHVYELLIGADGKVSTIWTLRATRFEPAFPAFNQAIVGAFRRWQFQPYHVNGVATPLCMSVTMNVDWN
jgi:hypothetical protein